MHVRACSLATGLTATIPPTIPNVSRASNLLLQATHGPTVATVRNVSRALQDSAGCEVANTPVALSAAPAASASTDASSSAWAVVLSMVMIACAWLTQAITHRIHEKDHDATVSDFNT